MYWIGLLSIPIGLSIQYAGICTVTRPTIVKRVRFLVVGRGIFAYEGNFVTLRSEKALYLFEMSDNREKMQLGIFAPGREFILPYLSRELPDYEVIGVDDASRADVAVLNPGDCLPEGLRESATVLFCPNIVGTGMTGLPMELAKRIARGSYYHLGGNDAQLSTIHAADVAKAVAISFGSGVRAVVSDGADPTFHDFAEALAWRINHKRILTLNSKWVNWIISPQLRRIITTDAVVDGHEFAERFKFSPTPVTEYLRTHVYDDESL